MHYFRLFFGFPFFGTFCVHFFLHFFWPCFLLFFCLHFFVNFFWHFFCPCYFYTFFALSCKKKFYFFFSEAKKEKAIRGKKGSLMQKSKIDVTKILIVPFFGSKNHNISAIVFKNSAREGHYWRGWSPLYDFSPTTFCVYVMKEGCPPTQSPLQTNSCQGARFFNGLW